MNIDQIWYLFLSIRLKYCSFCIHHQMESEAFHLSIKQSYRLFHTSEEHRFSVCNFWHTIFSPLSDPSRLHLATPFVILGCVHKKYGKNWWRIIKWHCKNNHFDFPCPTLQAFFCLKAIKIKERNSYYILSSLLSPSLLLFFFIFLSFFIVFLRFFSFLPGFSFFLLFFPSNILS